MKIGIVGTRGIPNNHGGFEQFAENLSKYLVSKKHEVYVYNSHMHPFQNSQWEGVELIHKYDPEHIVGTIGQFIYDFNCIVDSNKRKFDIILQLGYTSSSIWGWLLPKRPIIITNMDGLEWKRSKFPSPVQKFLKKAEKLAIKSSDYLISDSLGIQSYLNSEHLISSEYIAYGADLFLIENENVILEYGVKQNNYNLLIARLEPENNIETILDGVVKSKIETPFLVIGKNETKFGRYLKHKYINTNIRFLGGIYNQDHLNNLRFFSNLYFHGHSVGGTNPSLLEAMASNSLIVANNNIFNKSILGNDAYYFDTACDIVESFNIKKADNLDKIENNRDKIKNEFSWDIINNKYEKYFLKCLANY